MADFQSSPAPNSEDSLGRYGLSFIPEIFSAQLLVELRKTLVYGDRTNRNYEGEIRQGGSVRINSVTDIATGTYTAHSDITVQPIDTEKMTFKIDQTPYFAFELDDIENAQSLSGGALMAEAAAKTAYKLADDTDKYVAGLMSAAATAIEDVDAADSDAADAVIDMLIAMGVELDEKDVPTQGRWAVVTPSVHAKLLRTDLFERVDASGTSEALRNGQVGRAFGFDIIKSNNAPKDTADGGRVDTVIAGLDAATTFAQAIDKVEAFRPQYRFTNAVKGLQLYGAKVIRPEMLVKADVTVKDPS